MTIFGAMLSPRIRNAGLENPQVPISSATVGDLFGGPSVSAGIPVNEKSSLAMSAVWRSVNLIAGTIGSLPLHAYRADGEARVKMTSGQAARLLDKPHPDLTPLELWEAVCGCLLLWGNAYLWLGRDQLGSIRELWLLDPGKVKPGRTSAGVKVYQLGHGDVEATDSNILHVKGFSLDDVVGLSPIQMAKEGIGLALAAERFGAGLFAGGSLATGLLQTDVKLKPAEADALQARWDEKRRGLSNSSKTIVLGGGLRFERLTIPPGDAQFLESRSFQIAEIARMFGVPPHMLMETDKSTSWGTGIEQQQIGFLVFTLRPWLARLEQRITQILKPEPVYARFAVEGLLRADSKQRAEFYREMWSLGVYSTNDVRRFEELPPVDAGDVRYRPLNFGELGTTDSNA